jgi:hypothetical protein
MAIKVPERGFKKYMHRTFNTNTSKYLKKEQ